MFRPALLFAAALIAAPALAQPQPAQPPAERVPPRTDLSENVRVFEVPPGSRPHDVAPGPGNLVWYTGQRRGTLGILNPETGAVREVQLGAGSAPHGVIMGPDGAAWITDGGLNAIVRVDPATDAVRVWRLPEEFPDSNLNTAAFDREGRVWFTGQTGVYGRLDPRTDEMRVWRDPEGRGPYGIAATPDGEIYYVSLAGSHLARVNRETGEATIIEPPTPLFPREAGRSMTASCSMVGMAGCPTRPTAGRQAGRLGDPGPQRRLPHTDRPSCVRCSRRAGSCRAPDRYGRGDRPFGRRGRHR